MQFICPGCSNIHLLNVGKTTNPRWEWNKSEEKPTLSPSINFTIANYDGTIRVRCHSFVREGRIQFLNDCTHNLAGHIVDLPGIGT